MGIKTLCDALEYAAAKETKGAKKRLSEPKYTEKLLGVTEEDKISRDGVTEITLLNGGSSRVAIDIFDRCITENDVLRGSPDIRFTNLIYSVVYYGPKCKRYKPGRPFAIRSDLLRFSIRVSSWAHFVAISKEIPEVGWLARNTTICPCTFSNAKKCCGIGIPFALDIEKYTHKLTKDNQDAPVLVGRKSVLLDAAMVKQKLYGMETYGNVITRLEQEYGK